MPGGRTDEWRERERQRQEARRYRVLRFIQERGPFECPQGKASRNAFNEAWRRGIITEKSDHAWMLDLQALEAEGLIERKMATSKTYRLSAT